MPSDPRPAFEALLWASPENGRKPFSLRAYPTKLVIGLYSPAPRSGKTTAAEAMTAYYEAIGLTCEKIAFADPLRRVAEEVLKSLPGVSEEMAQEYLHEKKDWPFITTHGSYEVPATVRDALLIGIGNGAREAISPDVWVKAWLDAVAHSSADVIICDDVRRENEAHAVLNCPRSRGVMMKILRGYGSVEVTSTEGLLERMPFEAVLYNNGDKEALERRARKHACALLARHRQ